MHIDTSAEFWQAGAALVGTGGTGRDVPLPANVRAYMITGAPTRRHDPAGVPLSRQCAQLHAGGAQPAGAHDRLDDAGDRAARQPLADVAGANWCRSKASRAPKCPPPG